MNTTEFSQSYWRGGRATDATYPACHLRDSTMVILTAVGGTNKVSKARVLSVHDLDERTGDINPDLVGSMMLLSCFRIHDIPVLWQDRHIMVAYRSRDRANVL